MGSRDVLGMSVRTCAVEVAAGESERFDEAVITINGRELLDIVREAEVPFAEAEGHADVAGAYRGLPVDLAFLPSRHLLGQPDALYSDLARSGEVNKPAVLVCTCGEPGCWPLVVRIDVRDDIVVWSDFEQPHRTDEHGGRDPWSYDPVGPFEFDRSSYKQALARVAL
jgi:hypothetical protein